MAGNFVKKNSAALAYHMAACRARALGWLEDSGRHRTRAMLTHARTVMYVVCSTIRWNSTAEGMRTEQCGPISTLRRWEARTHCSAQAARHIALNFYLAERARSPLCIHTPLHSAAKKPVRDKEAFQRDYSSTITIEVALDNKKTVVSVFKVHVFM